MLTVLLIVVLVPLAFAAGMYVGWLRESSISNDRWDDLTALANSNATRMHDLRDERDQVDRELEVATGDLSTVEAERDASRAEVARLNDLNETTRGEMEAIEGELATARGRIGELESTVSSANTRLGELEAALLAANVRAATPGSRIDSIPDSTPGAEGRDDLKKINGIGPKIERLLNDVGISTWEQLAALDAADQDVIEQKLRFPGRIGRDGWTDQARALLAEAGRPHQGA